MKEPLTNMSETATSLAGVFPPIPTPFGVEGNVAYQALVENIERWNQYGLAGYVVLGSNGEMVYLSDREKARVWETARQAIPPDKLMIAGTGCESTRQTIMLSRQAADAGADAVLVLTPHYYGGQMTASALTYHFRTVADASSIPVVLYNMPRFTNVDMDAATVADIAYHPNIVGIKDSGGNVGKLAQIVGSVGPEFQVLAGSASFFLPALAVGAAGGVMALANIAPQQTIDLYSLFKTGRWDEAASIQQRLISINTAVTARFGIPGLKAALDMLGYYGGPVRSPLQPLGDPEVETLKAILAAGDVL
jgi:4-hydroxy-2-oxoglutarate aldolase